MLGEFSDGYEGSSKRKRMMEPNPYFAGNSAHPLYGYGYGYGYASGSHPFEFPLVRLRGLPFDCSEIDIIKFFNGLDIVDILLVNKKGRFSGEAFVVFASQIHVGYALRRDRENMGKRYVEVFKCKKEEYYRSVAAEVRDEGNYENAPEESAEKRDMEYTEVLRLRGLPFSVQKRDIINFFRDFEVVDDDRVQIVCRSDGKTTGEAFVEFISVEVAKKAMRKDRKTIGTRYVELFPSTLDEFRHAVSKSRQ